MKRWLIFTVIFACSLGLGWVVGLKKANVAASSAAADDPAAHVRPGHSAQQLAPGQAGQKKLESTTAAAERIAEKVREANAMEESEFLEFADGIALEDIMPFLERLVTQLGPGGLDFSKQSALRKMVARLGNQDLDAAMAWAKTCKNSKMAELFQGSLLEMLAESDPNRAAELYFAAKTANPNFDSQALQGVMQSKAQEGAAALLGLVSQAPRSHSCRIYSVDYPEGFDFTALAEGLASFNKQGGLGRPADMPGDFLAHWAKSDPEAAHLWYAQNGRIGFEGWGKIMGAVEETMGGEAAGKWAAEKWIAADPELRKAMAEEIAGWMGAPEPARVLAMLDGITDAEAGQQLIRQVLVHHGFGNNFETNLAPLLSRIPTRDMRLDILREVAKSNRFKNYTLSDSVLDGWQITREEVEALKK